MSLPKVLAIGMVVGLVAMLISLAGVLAQGGEGTVTIRDSDDTNYSDRLSDMAHINFTGLDVLPAGQVYEGWLVNTDAAGAPVRAQSTGRFTVDSDGNADMTYLSSGDAAGENIVTEFTTFVLSIEPVDDPDPGPSDDKPFADSIPASALVHIRHLLSSWQGNPAYTVGRYAGDPKGIAVGLREQTSIALFRAGLSHRSDTLADVQVLVDACGLTASDTTSSTPPRPLATSERVSSLVPTSIPTISHRRRHHHADVHRGFRLTLPQGANCHTTSS